MPGGIPKDKNGLTDKQKKFCHEYMIDLNATQAAIRAGYSQKTASVTAYENLTKPYIQEYIGELKRKTSEKLELTHERLTEEWKKIAFSSISHLHNTWVDRKYFESIKEDNPDILDCIESIETRVRRTEICDETSQEVEQIKIKLYSKTKALEELGKHIGYYSADNKQKQPIINNHTVIFKKFEENKDA